MFNRNIQESKLSDPTQNQNNEPLRLQIDVTNVENFIKNIDNMAGISLRHRFDDVCMVSVNIADLNLISMLDEDDNVLNYKEGLDCDILTKDSSQLKSGKKYTGAHKKSSSHASHSSPAMSSTSNTPSLNHSSSSISTSSAFFNSSSSATSSHASHSSANELQKDVQKNCTIM